MWQGVFYFIKLAIVVAIAIWVARHPGQVSIEWLGYRVDSSVGILLLAALVIAGIAALLYYLWKILRRAPGSVGRSLDASRRKKGYEALSQGMVAVAAGDVDEARRWARKADGLIEEVPLRRLLSAQAAQLAGDEAAAKRHFDDMLDSADTRFLGLRGLLMQALRDGDEDAAKKYLSEAYRLRPQTPWVLSNMIEVSLRAGDLDQAAEALQVAVRNKILPRKEAEHKRAAILMEKARLAVDVGQSDAAARAARDALKLAPDFTPASLLLARTEADHGKVGKARGILEKAWARQPHPEVGAMWLSLQADRTPLDRYKALDRFLGERESPEAILLLVRAALDAELWGEARRHLKPLTDGRPSHRVCALMAELELKEHGDELAAGGWWRRAETAEADPTWVCGNCGAVAEAWALRCRNCDHFDSLAWGLPPRIQTLALPEAVPEEAAAPASPGSTEVLSPRETGGETARPLPAPSPASSSSPDTAR